MKKISSISIAALSLLLICSCDNDGTTTTGNADSGNADKVDNTNGQPPASPIVATDEETSSFLKEAADGGMAEVRLGEMALQKSTNQRVKNFANMMVTDHSGANSKVKSFASERNITLPTDVSDKHKEIMDDLMKKEGKDFDKAYVKAMVEDHEKDIKKFEDAEGKVNDATVKNFITATLPVLRTHLDSIKAIQKAMR